MGPVSLLASQRMHLLVLDVPSSQRSSAPKHLWIIASTFSNVLICLTPLKFAHVLSLKDMVHDDVQHTMIRDESNHLFMINRIDPVQ